MEAEIRRLRAAARRLPRGKHRNQIRYPDRFRSVGLALGPRRPGADGIHHAPADLRKGFDRLSRLVGKRLRQDPLSGNSYLFVDATRKRVSARSFRVSPPGGATTAYRRAPLPEARTRGVTNRSVRASRVRGSAIAAASNSAAMVGTASGRSGSPLVVPRRVRAATSASIEGMRGPSSVSLAAATPNATIVGRSFAGEPPSRTTQREHYPTLNDDRLPDDPTAALRMEPSVCMFGVRASTPWPGHGRDDGSQPRARLSSAPWTKDAQPAARDRLPGRTMPAGRWECPREGPACQYGASGVPVLPAFIGSFAAPLQDCGQRW
jgi:IS66 Orf2 like protein